MLGIILLILKIIAIIIGVLMGLILLTVMLVLFVPVRYKIDASFYNKPVVHVKVSWLLNFLRFHFSYDDKEMKTDARILVFKLKMFNGGKKDDVIEDVSDDKQPDAKHGKSLLQDADESKHKEEQDAPVSGHKEEQDAPVSEHKEEQDIFVGRQEEDGELLTQPEKEYDKSDIYDKKEVHKRIGLLKKIKNIYCLVKEKIKSVFDKICDIIKKIHYKTVSLKDLVTEKVNSVKAVINNQEYRELAGFLFEQLKALLVKIKPKKYDINIRYGFDDPYTTGKVSMYAAVLWGMLGIDANIMPEFEQKIFEGSVFLKGRVTVFSLIVIAVKVYFNKLFKKIVIDRNI